MANINEINQYFNYQYQELSLCSSSFDSSLFYAILFLSGIAASSASFQLPLSL
jgi:hypothetical protein